MDYFDRMIFDNNDHKTDIFRDFHGYAFTTSGLPS